MNGALIIRTLAVWLRAGTLGWAIFLTLFACAAIVVFPQHCVAIFIDAWRPIVAALALAFGAHLFVAHFWRRAA